MLYGFMQQQETGKGSRKAPQGIHWENEEEGWVGGSNNTTRQIGGHQLRICSLPLQVEVRNREGASTAHFQDFKSEVLQIPNVVANLPVKSNAEVWFFAGDWSEVHKFLSDL
uniref:Histidine protein methyltransferase 1 homolog n=1 Tax=Tanacetum cinerariifolium TaxID=118510 RepID=A0A699I7C0_TANCI|nr:histidine protein methyltransferase 1 homolog [Tanacetum cinerariifolium]